MYGKYLVKGTQTSQDGVNLINSQMKHWTAYGVENNRMGFNGNVSVHDMSETYMVPLQIMLEANVSSAMCACLLHCTEIHRFGRNMHAHALCDNILRVLLFGGGWEMQVCVRRYQWHSLLCERLDEQHCAAERMGLRRCD
jgi:hypothetical protein|eukprot:COSAG02_NODE_1759_length_11042_cov_3.648725_5_plen_140_part_00